MSKVASAEAAGSIIRRVREERGISRAFLAKQTGIGARTIYALEQGESENFGLGNYLKLLDALEMNMSVDLDKPLKPPTALESSIELPELKMADIWSLDGSDEK